MWFRRILSGSAQEGAKAAKAVKNKKGWFASGRAGVPEQADNGWLSARALRQLDRLQLNTHKFLPGYAAGQRPSHRMKPAIDFREHRLYTPGDDVRFVDWKASARQEHIFIKQGEHLKNATIYLLVDCSASMAWGDPPKIHTAQSLASALGYLALAHGDRLFVVPASRSQASDGPRPLGPVSGKGQFPGLLKYLRTLRYEGQIDLARSLAGLRRQSSLGGGLVLVVSDLLGVEDLASGLRALPMPTWNLVFFHLLHPAEIDPSMQGDLEMQDIETGRKRRYVVTEKALETYRKRVLGWQESLQSACRERNAFYTLIPSDWTLEGEILPRLRAANVVKPL